MSATTQVPIQTGRPAKAHIRINITIHGNDYDTYSADPIEPDGIHVAPNGMVTFHANKPCKVLFDDPSFFGQDELVLDDTNHREESLPVSAEHTSTEFTLQSLDRAPRLQAMSETDPGPVDPPGEPNPIITP